MSEATWLDGNALAGFFHELFGVELTASDIVEGVIHERIEPAAASISLVRIIDGVIPIVGEVLDHECHIPTAIGTSMRGQIAYHFDNTIGSVAMVEIATSIVEADTIDLPEINPIQADIANKLFCATIVII